MSGILLSLQRCANGGVRVHARRHVAGGLDRGQNETVDHFRARRAVIVKTARCRRGVDRRIDRARLDKMWNDMAFDPCLLTNASYTKRPISFPNDNNGFRQLAVYRVEICERAKVKPQDFNGIP